MQVIERHLINSLEEIFSPLTVSRWPDEKILCVASEPSGVMRQRQFLEGRKKVLENESDVFNGGVEGQGLGSQKRLGVCRRRRPDQTRGRNEGRRTGCAKARAGVGSSDAPTRLGVGEWA